MTASRITQAEAADMLECATELMKAFPKSKARDYLGHWNELMLFLERVKREARQPSELAREER